MNNSKNGKMYIGILVNLVLSLVGAISWLIFGFDNTSVTPKENNMVSVFFALILLPAVIFYVIWYLKGVKALASATNKIPSFVPFMVLSIVAVIGLTVGAFLASDFDSGMPLFLALAAVPSIIGSVVSYIAFQP